MTMEHLRLLLDDPRELHSFFVIGEKVGTSIGALQRRGRCPNGEAHCCMAACGASWQVM